MLIINEIDGRGQRSGPVERGGRAREGRRLRGHVLARGAGGLPDREVLAVLLAAGGGVSSLAVAERLLTRAGSLAGLACIHPVELARMPGLGPGLTARLLAALEIGVRSIWDPHEERIRVQRPEDLHAMLRGRFTGLDRERFLALYLDTRHRVLAVETVSIGTLNLSVVHPREVFKLAVALSAAAVIVAHNHPSGCSTPSAEDLDLTARLDRCGQLLGIPLLDHLVAGADRIVSIREEGWPEGRSSEQVIP